MIEALGSLWNLLTANLRVLLIALCSSLAFIYFFPLEASGTTGVVLRGIATVSGVGAAVSVLDTIRLAVPKWISGYMARKAEAEQSRVEDETAIASIRHLSGYEKLCLSTAMELADDLGLFRRWPTQSGYLAASMEGELSAALATLRERKLIKPANPGQKRFQASQIQFWTLTTIVLINRGLIDKYLNEIEDSDL